MQKKLPLLWQHLVTCFLVYAFINQSATHAGLFFGTMKADRVLYLGNSITAHGPKPEIGWYGNWGMAASSADKDYVHVLTNSIGQEVGGTPSYMLGNLGNFERGFTTFDIQTSLPTQLAFQPDIVVVAIGENISVAEISTPESQAVFIGAFKDILETLKANSNPTIFVRSCFWVNALKDSLMRQATEETGCVFVDISALAADEANYAYSERDFDNINVSIHPGDTGMAAIAGELFSAMQAYAVPEPSSVVLLGMGIFFFSGWRLYRRSTKRRA